MFNIIILGLVSLLTDVSSEMVYPLLPLYLVNTLGATPALVGIIEGMAESLASLLKVFSGYHSDRLQSRKPLAISGYGFSGAAKLLFIFASSWPWVLWGRIGDRFGKGIRTAPRDALIAESADAQKIGWAFGLHRALDSMGAVIGVALAFYFITKYRGDYRAVFLWSLIPAFLGVACLFAVKETIARNRAKAKQSALSWTTLNPRLKRFLIVVFIFALGNSSNQFLLLRAQALSLSTPAVLLLYLLFNVIYTLAAFPLGALSDRVGRRTLLVLGYLLYGLVYFGFAVATHSYQLWLLFGLYGLYSAATEGVEKALVSEIAPESQKATLIGLHATLVGIGLLPASIIGGALWDYFGSSATFYFGGTLGFSAALGMAVVLSERKSFKSDHAE